MFYQKVRALSRCLHADAAKRQRSHPVVSRLSQFSGPGVLQPLHPLLLSLAGPTYRRGEVSGRARRARVSRSDHQGRAIEAQDVGDVVSICLRPRWTKGRAQPLQGPEGKATGPIADGDLRKDAHSPRMRQVQTITRRQQALVVEEPDRLVRRAAHRGVERRADCHEDASVPVCHHPLERGLYLAGPQRSPVRRSADLVEEVVSCNSSVMCKGGLDRVRPARVRKRCRRPPDGCVPRCPYRRAEGGRREAGSCRLTSGRSRTSRPI